MVICFIISMSKDIIFQFYPKHVDYIMMWKMKMLFSSTWTKLRKNHTQDKRKTTN